MTSDYVIRAGGGVVEVWSRVRLPFQPRGWLLDMRAELREALRALEPVPGATLHAVYGAAADGRLVDVENVLLYNVGTAAVRHLMRAGVSFERAYAYPEPPRGSGLPTEGLHYHGYFVAGSRQWTHWRPGALLASFHDIAVTRATPAAVWWAIRTQSAPPPVTHPAPSRFVVSLTAHAGHGPGSQPPNVSGLVKPLLDGVISAYHCHAADAESPAERLPLADLGEPALVRSTLLDPRWAALGPRVVVRPFGASGVAWNPADDLCVAATITTNTDLTPTANWAGWRLSGRLQLADPVTAELTQWTARGQ